MPKLEVARRTALGVFDAVVLFPAIALSVAKARGFVWRSCFFLAASISGGIGGSSITEVRREGLPQPALFAGATVFTQLVGGCRVATGFFAWLGALFLAGFTIAATLLGHRFWLRHGSEFQHELTTAWGMRRSSAGSCCSSSTTSRLWND